jgi:DHA1 family multidrug resistance protein-like MFS transporter
VDEAGQAKPRSGRLWPLMAGFGLGSFAWNVCQPFLPLRVQELGVGDLGEVARWAGVLVGLSSLLNALLAPAWTTVGARFGYRRQVLRAHIGTALGWALYGLSPSPWHMLGAAVALGCFSGNYPHYVALAAAGAARGEVGRVVGDLQAASQIGNTFGPLVGGFVASRFGVLPTFFVSAALSLVAVVMVVLTIPDDGAASRVRKAGSSGIGAALRRGEQRRVMALVLVGETGVIGLRPLIPIILSARLTDPSTVAAATGVATTLATAGAIVAAIVVGRLSRRYDPGRLLICTLPLATLCLLLVPFVAELPALVGLWALAGLFAGATTPAAFAWLGRSSPGDTGGYALLASTNMACYALGPLIMGQVSATNLDLPFYLAALATAAGALLLVGARSPAANT